MAGGNRTVRSLAVMELVGTMLLVATIQASSSTAPDQSGQAVVSVLIAIVYMGFRLSGAHYNPAITLTFVIRGRCKTPIAGLYVAMHFLGGFLGALFGSFVSQSTISFQAGKPYSWAQAGCAEFFFTTFLCLAVLTIALRKNVATHPLFGVAIASIVYAGALVSQPISGGSFNPAISICLSIVDGFANFHYALLQAMVQLCGAISASLLFYLVAPEELDAVSWPWPPAVCDDLASILK